jgi:hypothetical protein
MDDVSMAVMTNHQSLPLSGSHLLHPLWWGHTPWAVEFPQGSNMVHLDSIM